jgi:hypothetical protein
VSLAYWQPHAAGHFVRFSQRLIRKPPCAPRRNVRGFPAEGVHMDAPQFDRLTRYLQPDLPSRRGLLRVLLASIGTMITQPAFSAGAKPKKVTLCHRRQTVSVSKKAKRKHLKHGDTPGPCPPAPPPGGCTPSCEGKRCGEPDRCGGTCTACADGKRCQNGQCVVDPCTPSCAGKTCGQDDGCGVACITQAGCAAGQVCSPQGQCEAEMSCPAGQIWCPGTDYCAAGDCCSDFGGGAVSSGTLCGDVCVHAICCAVGGPAPSGSGSCCGGVTPQGGSCCLPTGAFLSDCATRPHICCSTACNGDFCA